MTRRALSSVAIVAGVLATASVAHAQLTVVAPQINLGEPGTPSVGMVIAMNTSNAGITITDFVKVSGACPNPSPFGTPNPLPHTVPAMGSFTFAIGVGPFSSAGTHTCRIAAMNTSNVAEVNIVVNTGPLNDIDGGVHIAPNGLAFGSIAPGSSTDLTLLVSTIASQAATVHWQITGIDSTMFSMTQPCTINGGGSCDGGTLVSGADVPGLVQCAPGPGAITGWKTANLSARGYMTMVDSIALTCDVRNGATPPPVDANMSAVDGDPGADARVGDDAGGGRDGGGPTGDGGGNPLGGDNDLTTYYACGCNGGTGGIGAAGVLLALLLAGPRRRRT